MTQGELARLGFADPDRARHLLAAPTLGPLGRARLLAGDAAAAADPDLALTGLDRMVEALMREAPSAGDRAAVDEFREALTSDTGLRTRLLAVLGHSAALAEHLARHPTDWRTLVSTSEDRAAGSTGSTDVTEAGVPRAELLGAVDVDTATEPGTSARDALRIAYRRRLLSIAADDLTGVDPVERTAERLADLADAALEAALAVARAELGGQAAACRLAVIGLGKCGGRELNYASDVDVVFVTGPAEPTHDPNDPGAGSRLAAAMIRVCTETTAEGSLWPVDTGLRPEGRNGPLVRTLAGHVAYYERWAKTWEFQALLKARPVAGDAELGAAYVRALAPLVWNAASREGFVEDVQAMRRRVIARVPVEQGQRELKLGPGGLRDVEFAIQLLQLVHGRTDETVRDPNTLAGLAALTAGGYVGRDDAAALTSAYRFLRSVEHLQQLRRLRRTHLFPRDADELRRLGRALGYGGRPGDPVIEVTDAWRAHTREVRRLHEKLFYRPVLRAVSRLPGEEARLTAESAEQRLEALGYADPAGALRHIEALTGGVSRSAAIQRTLLPVLLGWFADAADPDAGLVGFRRVSEALGGSSWYLRALRDEGVTARRLAYLLASGRYATGLLLRTPEFVASLGDDGQLQPVDVGTLTAEMRAAARRHEEPGKAVGAVRRLRGRELLRVATVHTLGLLDVDDVGRALTDIAEAAVRTGLDVARRSVAATVGALPGRFTVIGMGRLGGAEMGYGSDGDVLFVYQPSPGADGESAARAAQAVAEELRRLFAQPGPDPPFHLDAGLRPEGRDGPLVRTLASYEKYYTRWFSAWERQALLRARPVGGDVELGERFRELIDPLRYPAGGIDPTTVREIRRLKARMEAERLPRGADPSLHTKLGPGGLADVEWTVQLVQLRYAGRFPDLCVTGTVSALSTAAALGFVDADDAVVLSRAWRTATRLRDAVLLVRGRGSDVLPSDARTRAATARLLGYPPDEVARMPEDYRRDTRRARAVVRRVFFDGEGET